MLWLLTFFLLLQQWFSTISLKGAKSRPTNFQRAAQKILPQDNYTFCFTALTKSVTPNFRGVTERHCPSKGILSRSKDSDTNLLQSINFAYEVGVISSYSNWICHRRIAKRRSKDALELHAALRTVFEPLFSK